MTGARWGGAYTDVAGLHGSALDASFRQRVSRPSITFSSLPAADGAQWRTEISGSGTTLVIPSQMTAELYVAAGAGIASMVSPRLPATPGRGQFVQISAILGEPQVGVVRRVGVFDATGGLFWQLDGSGIAIGRRVINDGLAVDEICRADKWNRASEPIDSRMAQAYGIDWDWSTGIARWFIIIDNISANVHQVAAFGYEARALFVPADMPLRCEIINDGTGEAAALRLLSAVAGVDA